MSQPCDTASILEVIRPARHSVPLVFASPHSGSAYPDEFVQGSNLDPLSLRRSEDSFVDQLFATAHANGAPLLRALFPRAFCDPNREPYELDPAMFEDDLPAFANTRSPRVAAGLGTIARVVANGAEIYGGKLRYAEISSRINGYYKPYHAALRALVDETRDAFGFCVLVDCHSMPSIGGPMDKDPGESRVDFVLGDCFGTACAPAITDTAERCLTGLGYVVTRNDPYAGGFTTRHYGRPADRVHALQIEINRALYMNEETIRPSADMPTLASNLGQLVDVLGRLAGRDLAPR
ncbi:MAG: N-formylglutamate amidohydrolase [Proteobacteria bacterium]|nr:N-formylglutamate amidohydrolase [Pseudomonadota bacterium]